LIEIDNGNALLLLNRMAKHQLRQPNHRYNKHDNKYQRMQPSHDCKTNNATTSSSTADTYVCAIDEKQIDAKANVGLIALQSTTCKA
jgi:hypothetical protein